MHSDAAFWDRIAAKYARDPIKDVPAYEHTLERTRSFLTSHASVLEVGCGTGATALRLADAAGRIVGTDISAAMIDIARARLDAPDTPRNVSFSVAAMTDEALPHGPFDVVTAFNSLHLVRDLDAALAAIARRLRPGGLFISKTVCLRDSPLRFLKPVFGLLKPTGRIPHVLFLSQPELQERIRASGFRILEVGNFPKKPPRHFVVARRLD
ncbi:methyltransferase domain-containing protein [Microvirga tunisiensis]|uniref:Methyltransferase domain-containing protein n=2 Tax=Pannonibacter tanglangensis TaxID=2750084 RepID=A0A7X5F514_9HYPH|nr:MULTISPECIES: class I SAM-dependent methyltransferase [unclassified Pannonibacter]NBN63050.1 methyltransferase domain-containing protein [Pannonibacter sp. XCT-34]NBN78624.1 methyltransferase domain-containing protein [Pannonibacter sp. XCT-53]